MEKLRNNAYSKTTKNASKLDAFFYFNNVSNLVIEGH